jgi:hypothetical protein
MLFWGEYFENLLMPGLHKQWFDMSSGSKNASMEVPRFGFISIFAAFKLSNMNITLAFRE